MWIVAGILIGLIVVMFVAGLLGPEDEEGER